MNAISKAISLFLPKDKYVYVLLTTLISPMAVFFIVLSIWTVFYGNIVEHSNASMVMSVAVMSVIIAISSITCLNVYVYFMNIYSSMFSSNISNNIKIILSLYTVCALSLYTLALSIPLIYGYFNNLLFMYLYCIIAMLLSTCIHLLIFWCLSKKSSLLYGVETTNNTFVSLSVWFFPFIIVMLLFSCMLLCVTVPVRSQSKYFLHVLVESIGVCFG